MHRHHQKVFQVGPEKKLIPKRSKPQNTCLSEEMVEPEWGRAGSHSIPLPLLTAGAHAGRGAERVTVTVQLQHTVTHHVLIVNVTSEQQAKAVCPSPSKARWCSGLKRGTVNRVCLRGFEAI